MMTYDQEGNTSDILLQQFAIHHVSYSIID